MIIEALIEYVRSLCPLQIVTPSAWSNRIYILSASLRICFDNQQHMTEYDVFFDLKDPNLLEQIKHELSKRKLLGEQCETK